MELNHISHQSSIGAKNNHKRNNGAILHRQPDFHHSNQYKKKNTAKSRKWSVNLVLTISYKQTHFDDFC